MAIFATFENLDWFSLFHTPVTPLTIALKHFIRDHKRRNCNRKEKETCDYDSDAYDASDAGYDSAYDYDFRFTLDFNAPHDYDYDWDAIVNQTFNPLETVYYLQLVKFQLRLFTLLKLKAKVNLTES